MTIILHALLLIFTPSLLPAAHSNVVGEVRIENFKNSLLIDAILDKRALAVVLMNEGNCEPREMMEKCGHAYFQEHVQLKVNGERILPAKLSMEMQKEAVIYHYEWTNDTPITSIEVFSDYILSYHEHSVLQVLINIDDLQKHYSLKADNKKITLITNQAAK